MELDEVFQYIPKIETMYFATMEDDQPRVRCMALIYHNGRYWALSPASRPKISQIRKNNKFEFASVIENPTYNINLRAKGKTLIIDDLEIKKEISTIIPWFSGYFESYDSPEFALLELIMEEIEAKRSDDKNFYKYDLKTKTKTAVIK